MENTKYRDIRDMISEKTRNEIHAAGDKLSFNEGLQFISSDLKIAPSCTELILTTLGYIYHVNDRIELTPRASSVLFYEDSDINRPMFTLNGLELFYRLVSQSICRNKNQLIIHPIIFDGYVQNLAGFDDTKLVYLDMALDEICTTLNMKYHTTIDTYRYNAMLENINMFKFKSNGDVLKCIGDFDVYTYYIYNTENVDEYGIANALSINSAEMYISEKTYDKLLRIIDEEFAYMVNTAVKAEEFTDTEEGKTNEDPSQETKKPDTDISLRLFMSIVRDSCNSKCSASDITKVMADLKLIKIGDNNSISINEPNNFLYTDEHGNILVKTEKLYELLTIVISKYNFSHTLIGLTPNTASPYMQYNDMFNGYGCCKQIPLSKVIPINIFEPFRPEFIYLNDCPIYTCNNAIERHKESEKK